jgi:MFS family permease
VSSAAAVATAEAAAAPAPVARPGRVLAVVSAAVFMASLDLFVVNIAFPDIARDFHGTSLSGLSWVLNAYTIVFAALLVPAGRVGDHFGNKRVFIGGLWLFTLASFGCAVSSNLWLIVAFRVVQAVGGAAIVPTSLGLILTTIAPARRQHAVRIWTLLGSVGGAAGPVWVVYS